MLKNLTPRLYQETIFSKATSKNTLVVLPTGLGKTALAMMMGKHRLNLYPDSKIVVLAPTKPLVQQHLETFKKHVEANEKDFVLFTGNVSPEKREKLWKDSKFIFSTPQGLENDVISSRISLENVSLLVFDEAHRAAGDYSYTFIAKQYQKKSKYPRILGLTASPGSEMEKINEICQNLFIENIETRTETDSDVKEYVQDIKIDRINVNLPASFLFIKKTIEQLYNSRLNEVKNLGYLNSVLIRKTDLLKLQAELHSKISSGEKNIELFRSISLIAEATKIQHALELLETQGIHALYQYLQRLKEESFKTTVKAVKNLVNDEKFNIIFETTKKLYENKIDHPKLDELKKIILENNKATNTDENSNANCENPKIIVFSHYRDTASKIKTELDKIGIKSTVFVGQAKKGETGLNQKQQKQILDEFRNGIFNVLIATSVAEEGLDVPSVDLVVFYEPVPSAIRTIQRRGRTARNSAGKVIILIANKTRDERYQWSNYHKEKRMQTILGDLNNKIALNQINTKTNERMEMSRKNEIEQYMNTEHQIEHQEQIKKKIKPQIKIVCDDREKNNGIIKQLIELGAFVELKRLDSGDYAASERCVVELKTMPDFVDSIIDGRLLEQIKCLSKFDRPILILEGTEDLYSQRNLHPNAIRGMISTIAVSYGIPIIQTKNNKETAELLYIIAKREQDPDKKLFNIHGSKKPLNNKELQEYIVSSLPNVGSSLAKELLHNFRNIRKIFSANDDELRKVPGVGEKTSKEIQKILDKDYYLDAN